jgi:voltage-gated potassium channel
LFLVGGATLAFVFERSESGANLTSYGDALWWSAVTMATVGYGDYYPISPAGRGVAVALMLFGIASLSGLTAAIAAYLVRETDENAAVTDLARRIHELHAEIVALRSERMSEPR